MGYSNFEINGIPIKNPTSFRIERYKVSDLTRLASAKMVGDLVARKRKFLFGYEVLESYNLDLILKAVWDAPGMFFTLKYIENGVTKTATVYPGAIPTELHRGDGAVWVWKNVNFDLIEQ